MDLMYINYAFGDEIRLVMREGARLLWHLAWIIPVAAALRLDWQGAITTTRRGKANMKKQAGKATMKSRLAYRNRSHMRKRDQREMARCIIATAKATGVLTWAEVI